MLIKQVEERVNGVDREVNRVTQSLIENQKDKKDGVDSVQM